MFIQLIRFPFSPTYNIFQLMVITRLILLNRIKDIRGLAS